MDYHFSKIVNYDFDMVLAKVKEELGKEGFGVITEIDIKQTLKDKIGVNFHKYKVLGACNPGIAYEALQAEPKIGILLPCNVVIQEHHAGKVEISFVDPASYMLVFKNDKLSKILATVTEKLENVFDNITTD